MSKTKFVTTKFSRDETERVIHALLKLQQFTTVYDENLNGIIKKLMSDYASTFGDDMKKEA